MRHTPNPETYRPWLGEDVNKALFQLVAHKNAQALTPLGVNEYLKKMVSHWWKNEFPNDEFPAETKLFLYDLDFVQSA